MSARWAALAAMLCLTLPGIVLAGGAPAGLTPDQALQLGKTLGANHNGNVSTLAGHPDLTTVPGYQGTNVPEAQYGSAGTGIEDLARQALPNSPVGQFVQHSALTRPQFAFSPTDPLLQRGNAVTNDPQAVIGQGLTGQYSGCQTVTTNAAPATFTTEYCTAWGIDQTQTCQKTLQLSCDRPVECDAGGIKLDSVQSDMQWTYTYPDLTIGTPGDNYWQGWCTVFDRATTFTIEDIQKVGAFTLAQAGFDDWIRIAVNGHVVYIGPHGGDRLDVISVHGIARVQYSASRFGACDLNTSWVENLNIDIKPYLRTGLNTIDMRVIVGGGGEGWMKFKATQYCDCQWSETWNSSCANLEQLAQKGLCVQQTETCSQPGGTRVIDGIPVQRACWQKQDSYLCATGGTREEPYCQELRSRGCRQVNSTCVNTLPDGTCHEYRQTYQCPQSNAVSQTVMNCGGQSFCLNGNCFDTGYSPNQDFALAASQLGAVDAAAKDFNTATMTIFQGRDMRCGKTALGFSDCCKASGWGIDLSLAQCSGVEKQLGQQREGGQCHFVGEYCSDHSLFGCLERKQTYCCFNSKLARIIQEQGRPQLGLGWGSAQAPNCSGITPQQLTQIDFSRIDFSEFYADALTAANSASRPSPDQVKATIEQRLQSQLP